MFVSRRTRPNSTQRRIFEQRWMSRSWTQLRLRLWQGLLGGHGELTSLVQCFENVIEMNFVLSEGAGTVVALDGEAMGDATGIVAEARRIVLEERG